MAEKNRTTNLPKDHIQSANTIDKYFSSISPSETATRKEKTASSKQTNTAGDFYSKLLSKQLLERKRKDRDDDNSVSDISEVSENEDADSDHGKCNDVGCMNQTAALEKENSKLHNELKEMRKKYRTVLQLVVSKDLRIQTLENILQHGNVPFNAQDLHAEQFSSFKKFIPEKVLVSLRSLDFDKKKDSVFLRTCISALYKDNLGVIALRTVTGTKERVIDFDGKRTVIPAKAPVTPEKLIIMSKIFDERVDALPGIDELEKNKRKSEMNTLLAKVIAGMSTKLGRGRKLFMPIE